jgi:hypothetical protein
MVPQDQKAIQQPEGECRHDDQVPIDAMPSA